MFNIGNTKLKIFVPQGYGETYRKNQYWSRYSDIINEYIPPR